ncbi:GLUCOSE-1-PHOSPHATE ADENYLYLTRANSFERASE FAMILY PROTEIN-RELATED [Salix purpurea]|uniref:GLUCOSE-1-PHOSPHATE ADENYLYLTRANSFERASE FAMILY PROTEIN-RELATED n=1 Tax=Salix purpurea TaxID=77065 RepID=A0A9Q0ZAR8_SALPP|nr:GLUCOSE-1-PHOSPHATE ADENYLYLTRANSFERASE FAMILY PROTEIN-RELATED [Salix purpurea]
MEFHRAHGGEASIMVTKWMSHQSMVLWLWKNPRGKVERFVEKPKAFVGNNINAGIYLLNQSVVDRIEPKPTSIEKEVFPKNSGREQALRNGASRFLDGHWTANGLYCVP